MGSSPRVRGKRPHPRRRRGPVRLIPARAGKTPPHEQCWQCWRAHPRACGENNRGSRAPCIVPGSSPRVRGKLRGTRLPRGPRGLIPARAGKTWWTSRTSGSRRAHPRACGENRTGVVRVVKRVGSSPRVRGKPAHAPVPAPPGGLIPARAGKTSSMRKWRTSSSAYPRACGENPISWTKWRVIPGSSPRVRGKLREGDHPGLPALAHPRACGENLIGLGADLAATGSSPRVRGKL